MNEVENSAVVEDEKNEKYVPLIPVTVRLAPEIYDVISGIADRNDISKAEAVRLAVDNRLLDYVGKVQYVYPEQGKEIRLLLGALATEMQKIRMEINRIGVNYNQEMKLKNIEKKYRNSKGIDSLMLKMKEEEKVKNGIDVVSEEGLNELLDRCDEITKRFGDVKCLLG
jgi:squalene cyclase